MRAAQYRSGPCKPKVFKMIYEVSPLTQVCSLKTPEQLAEMIVYLSSEMVCFLNDALKPLFTGHYPFLPQGHVSLHVRSFP